MGLLEQLDKFSHHIIIPSRDEGLVRYKPFGTQRYIRQAIVGAVEEGIHDIVFLKPRQIGASTEMLCIDCFWMIRHKGMQGAVITQDDGALKFFTDVIRQVAKSIPPEWSPPIRVANRTLLAWNVSRSGKYGGSRLLFLNAGKGGRLSRGRGMSFLHATEIAFWQDPSDVQSLRATLSQRHPAALYVWESTANGFNHFHDMWKDGQRAATTRCVFVGWWLHELYTLDEGNKAYKVYVGKESADERAWARQVKRGWDHTITPAQWAWYRWMRAEKMLGDELMMHQEFPTLPEHAFQASGYGFLPAATMVNLRESTEAQDEKYYRYTFGPLIEDTHLDEAGRKGAQLTVWEEPRENQRYVVACDPAYGSGESGDPSVITVWRAEPNRLVQCARLRTTDITVTQYAWVCAHLGGTYQTAHLILEINGPGMVVLQELQRLEAWGWGTSRHAELSNVMGGIQHYIYRRPDRLSGAGGFWQWQSTANNKQWIMTRLRDQIMADHLVIRSDNLIEELDTLRQDGDEFEAAGKAHDDEVMTAALAVECWADQVVPVLSMMAPTSNLPGQPVPETAEERMLQNFFEKLGAKA